MVDTEGYKQIQASAEKTKKAIETGQWTTATTLWSTTENVIMRVTKNIDFYNILTKVSPMYKWAGIRHSKSMAEGNENSFLRFRCSCPIIDVRLKTRCEFRFF